MSDTASNPAAIPKDAKATGKKRKAKADANVQSPSGHNGSDAQENGVHEASGESPYLKELNRLDSCQI